MAYEMRDPGGGSSGKILLYQGSSGQNVRDIQKKLSDLGYDVGGVDGIYGQKTETAVKQFQRDAGIDVDGIVGTQTLGALAAAKSTGAPRKTTYSGGAPKAQPVGNAQAPSGSQQIPAQTAVSSKQASGLEGYIALQNQLQEFSQLGRGAMAPYEELIRSYLTSQPTYEPISEEDLLAMARERAALMVNPQRLALQQQMEEIQRQAEASRQRIEADYAGSEDAVNRALALARQQATESAIARGGGRSGQVDYFTGKLQEPIMTGFQQQQSQRAASLADIESALSQGTRQAQQMLAQLADQEGFLTTQHLASLRDTGYSRAQQEWLQGLQAAMGLAGLAGQQNIYNMNYAQGLLPYIMLTELQRQGQPIDWAQLMGLMPGGF